MLHWLNRITPDFNQKRSFKTIFKKIKLVAVKGLRARQGVKKRDNLSLWGGNMCPADQRQN